MELGKAMTNTPRDCMTCLYIATHEKCDGCLNTSADYEKYRTCGVMPPNRYQNWVESDPLTQMKRFHEMQVSGARNIVLGSGEAEVNANDTPQKTSENLHYVAEECGYGVDNLTHDRGDGKRSLTVWKDFGPFRIEWEHGRLVRILRGENQGVFWEADDKLYFGPTKS